MRPVGLLLLCAVGWAAEGPDMQASTHGQCALPLTLTHLRPR